MRTLVLAVFGLVWACAPKQKDSVHPVVCGVEEPAPLPAMSDEALADLARRAPHVLRGRVRFSGSAVTRRGGEPTTHTYLIVDTLEFLKGDPFQVHTRYRRAFPLLAPESGSEAGASGKLLGSLRCQEDEAFLFFVGLPVAHTTAKVSSPPAPVQRSFGVYDVELFGILPEDQRRRVGVALD